MSLGLGLFLGSIFLGTVLLYIKLQPKINWGKARKLFLILSAVPFSLGFILLGGYFSYEQYQNRAKVISEFQGIRLGDKFSNVVFRVGTVERAESVDVKSMQDYLDQNQSSLSAEELEHWRNAIKNAKDEEQKLIATGKSDGKYSFKSDTVHFEIANDTVRNIGYNCKDEQFHFDGINGVFCGDSGDRVVDKFGDDVRILCSSKPDNYRRAYDVVKYGTRFYLEKNEVMQIFITTPAVLESLNAKNWIKC